MHGLESIASYFFSFLPSLSLFVISLFFFFLLCHRRLGESSSSPTSGGGGAGASSSGFNPMAGMADDEDEDSPHFSIDPAEKERLMKWMTENTEKCNKVSGVVVISFRESLFLFLPS